ncbi:MULTISPECIES: bis(5'-nucleosyl)-tetraphosphatase (symmetrical) YqeK [Helcococcus]|uniref:bis(5'-nucleosyl)-tetraphosphatase (symmetrical) n=1 Tax=Helcococcus bovis TaxID=3153252 RepID=A0ABW9F7L1_9FIRM
MALSFENIKLNLQKVLKVSRYEHVLRVNETALRLNKDLNLGLNEDEIQYACLLHDCAKNNEEFYFEKFKEKYNLKEKEVFEIPVLAHTILGSIVAKEIYGVENNKVLDAIRWHTTGKADMTLLEKLVFIADYIEPERSFETVDEVRKKVMENFDLGILLSLNNQIKYLISINAIIDLKTVEARNYLQRSIDE